MAVQLNQTESERRMHRILYFVKYLRVMILNLLLSSIAVVLYLLFGITGIYPGAVDTINALRSQPTPNFYLVNLTLMTIFLGVFFVWLYISITRVYRKSLKAQSIFIFIATIFTPLVVGMPQLLFSYNNLDPLFTWLLAVAWVFVIWMCLDISVGLWKASSSPDAYSFVATLDPRLTKGLWSFTNKVLDLPRTPFKNWRLGFAYLLAFSGSVLLLASLVYFVTIGSISNKAAQLLAACNASNMQSCAVQSATWAKQIGLWIIPAFLGIQIAVTVQSSARRLCGMSVTEALRESKGRYALYLRPFGIDETLLPKPKLPLISRLLSIRPFPTRIEEELFDVTDGYIPLIAVGNPTANKDTAGGLAFRDWVDDEHWQSYVRDKIKEAESIVLLLDWTRGVLWELENVIEQAAAPKTMFLFHPRAQRPEDWQGLTRQIIPVLINNKLLPTDFQFASRAMGFYFVDSELVEIYNSNWSTTSYRTAISCYLSDRAPTKHRAT